jgi:hypothetical protein
MICILPPITGRPILTPSGLPFLERSLALATASLPGRASLAFIVAIRFIVIVTIQRLLIFIIIHCVFVPTC